MIHLAFKGAKKANKTYKKRQAEKRTREDIDVKDPSEELEAVQMATSRTSTSGDESPGSNRTADPLENDPEFKLYMEHQKAIYLSRHRESPPCYDHVSHIPSPNSPEVTVNEQHRPFHVPSEPDCNCHECVSYRAERYDPSHGRHDLHNQILGLSELPVPEFDAKPKSVGEGMPELACNEAPQGHPPNVTPVELQADVPLEYPKSQMKKVAESSSVSTSS